MADIKVVAGPAGSGKSEWVRDHVDRDDVVIDVGRLLPALFPGLEGLVRGDLDREALRFTSWLRMFLIHEAVRRGLKGYVTTADPGAIDRLLEAVGGTRAADLIVIDPGREEVLRRLAESQPGRGDACQAAVDKWYSQL